MHKVKMYLGENKCQDGKVWKSSGDQGDIELRQESMPRWETPKFDD